MEPRSKDHWISTSTKTAVCNMLCTTQPKLLIFNSVFLPLSNNTVFYSIFGRTHHTKHCNSLPTNAIFAACSKNKMNHAKTTAFAAFLVTAFVVQS